MIKIDNLSIRFGKKQVLNGLCLEVLKNNVFGFIGKNGAGKTTTMKVILGLLTPNAGSVYVNGSLVDGKANTNKDIGYLPDVPEFYDFMKADEFLYFCAKLTRMHKNEIKSRILEVLKLVGLENEKSYIKGYSRGMKQRLGIAQALLHRPKILICDEPTSALDPIGRKEILDILKKISKDTTVLFSTHILSDVEKICDNVAFLDEGIIKLQGDINEIKSKYKKDEFTLEVENEYDLNLLINKFTFLNIKENNQLSFYLKDNNLNEILNFITLNKISLIKLEKNETTLESLFMEVIH